MFKRKETALYAGADTGGWRGDIRHPLTDSGRGVAPP